MLLDLIAGLEQAVHEYSLLNSPLVILLLKTLGLVGLSWTLWRLWTFSIFPHFPSQRNAPKELPYAVPVLGHAFAFIKNAQQVIERGRSHFASNHPFALTVGGRRLYVVQSPEDVAAVYKNNVTLSWDAMLAELLRGFGVSSAGSQKLWDKIPLEVLHASRAELPLSKVAHVSVIHSTLDLYKRQLLPGPRYEAIRGSLIGGIERLMGWDVLTDHYHPTSATTIPQVSLKQFCSTILIEAVTRTLFGNGIYDLEPGMTELLEDFNQDAWMLVFEYPQGPESRLHRSRKRLLNAFTQYVKGKKATQKGQAWLIERQVAEIESADISDEDRGALLLMVYWAANINPYRLGFWMLAYIIFDPKLMADLKKEVAPAFVQLDHTVNHEHILEHCPKLDSVYKETMRIVSGALSARKIVAPTVVGGKVLQAGGTILIPFKQLHYNKDIFGEDPGHFDAYRFTRDPSLYNSPSFRPFGGGVNYCPGRFLARQEMLMFTAIFVNNFNVTVSNGANQSFPKLDTLTPALGINGSVDGMDVFMDLEYLR